MKAKGKTEAAKKNGADCVCARPPSDGWILVGFLVFLGLLLPIVCRLPGGNPPNPLPWPAVVAMGASFFVPGILLGMWLYRLRVTATETGLCWCRWFKQTETPWAEIGDFYLAPFERRRNRNNNETGLYPDLFVLDKQGHTVAAFCSRFRNADAVKARIAERATEAKLRAWATKGTRPFDPLPRVFNYNTCENRITPVFLVAMCYGAAAFFGYLCIDSILRSLARHEFGWWTLGGAGVLLVLGGVYSLLYSLASKSHKAAIHANERFIVDSDGFTFCTPTHFERVLWKNVTGYGYAPRQAKDGPFGLSCIPPCRIETRDQGAFDFTTLIGDAMVLREIVRVNAIHTNQTDWPAPPPVPDKPGDPRLRWSSGVEGVGEQIFHSRTESGRAFLWLAALPSGVTGLLAVFAYFDLLPNGNVQSHLKPLVFFAPLLAWAVWRYYAAQIRVGEAGITQKTLWGQIHIAWADVQSVTPVSPNPFGAKIVGANGRVICWTNGFLEGETELRALLAARVPTA